MHSRKGHASLNMRSRVKKARKIEALLGLACGSRPLKMLEIGTGSGAIAHYFANHETLNCRVWSIDVEDKRQIETGYQFSLVNDVLLPFPDGMFDVVLSNHVIEHVGDQSAQIGHLQEIKRVMQSDGIGYLAVPNRWQWIEPHYKLARLSWLPESLRTPYVRFRNRGELYDCRPLSDRQLENMLDRVGLNFKQYHKEALRLTFEIERPDAKLFEYFIQHVPNWVFNLVRRAFPTLICEIHLHPEEV